MRKIIFFQAHPDDLEFYCYHLLRYLSEKKGDYNIRIASLTRGEYGWPKHAEHFKGSRLGKLRTQELFKAMRTYGIKKEDIHFFEIIDGYVQFDKQTVEKIKEYLNKENPDMIFACEPDRTYYRHPDHMNTGKLVYFILDKNSVSSIKKPKLFFYGSIGTNFYWPFNKEAIISAFKNMHVHKSQMHIWKLTKKLYHILVRIYGMKINGWKYAEGYRRVYYGKERIKNKSLNFWGHLFLTINIKLWPKKVTKN